MSGLTYDERDALTTILRVGGPNLARNLETWGGWIRETEQAKFDRNVDTHSGLTLLSLLGIHGKDALR